MRSEVLRMERVSCQEQGVIELDDFNLNILSGEIMGLLPINNHGLTALLRLLQYNTPLRYGYVNYREEQVNTWRDSKQRHNRIGLIQSESCLVEGLTVSDNIFVLRPEFHTWLLRPSALRKQLLPFLESIGVHLSADTHVDELTGFEKVVVDVLKSVVAGCKLTLLRDISANLGEAELKKIHRLLKYYADQGFSFLYIDFHLKELKQVCDRVALMSDGRIVKILQSDEITEEFFKNYTGAFQAGQRADLSTENRRSAVLEAVGLTGILVNNLSFAVAPGECVVLQSADIQVFEELLAILSGELAPQRGEIRVDGRAVPLRIGGDIAMIQELPTETMLFREMSYLDNLCFLVDRRLPEVWRDKRVRNGIKYEYEALLGSDVFDKRVDALSEIQKYELVYTRVAIQKPKAVFCVQPFRRADMELRVHIYGLIKRLLERGIAVVILVVNLEDSLSLADRLVRIQKD
ncbi:MAG: ATP-binding cassette domain-containing protein [Firmicutes bacterium]|nr:ATP-binding cassette domain-containing protein [Bacillota bacterium]